jgi:hypothetical protein
VLYGALYSATQRNTSALRRNATAQPRNAQSEVGP